MIVRTMAKLPAVPAYENRATGDVPPIRCKGKPLVFASPALARQAVDVLATGGNRCKIEGCKVWIWYHGDTSVHVGELQAHDYRKTSASERAATSAKLGDLLQGIL